MGLYKTLYTLKYIEGVNLDVQLKYMKEPRMVCPYCFGAGTITKTLKTKEKIITCTICKGKGKIHKFALEKTDDTERLCDESVEVEMRDGGED